jgi:hypothetical protein
VRVSGLEGLDFGLKAFVLKLGFKDYHQKHIYQINPGYKSRANNAVAETRKKPIFLRLVWESRLISKKKLKCKTVSIKNEQFGNI